MSTASQTHGTEKNALNRIISIPLITELCNSLLSVIQSHGVTAAIYGKGETLFYTILDASKPIQERLPLATANAYANKSLDFVQHRYPKAFEIHTDEIVANARKPADAAVEIFQTRLHGAQASLSSAQDRLAAAVSKVPKNGNEASKAMSDVLAELNKLKDSTASTAKELPANVQNVVNPLVESLTHGAQDITNELSRKDIPIATRASNVLKYSRENAEPVIRKTLDDLKSLVVSKKNEASDAASQAGDKAGSYAEAAKKDAVGSS